MSQTPPEAMTLPTAAGVAALQEYRLRQGGREWSVLHTGTILNRSDETRAIVRKTNRVPYGIALWPASIALAHEVAARPDDFRGRTVLELGSGTGLPGIVAATLGARVVQTDHDELVLDLCRRNGERNAARDIEYRRADWTAWDDTTRYDWIIGADILYFEGPHADLGRIFAHNLAPGGRLLLADPFREMSVRLLEAMEAEGWGVVVNQYDIGEPIIPRPIGVFEVAPPGR